VAEPRERKRYQKYKKKKKTNLLFIGKKENTYTHTFVRNSSVYVTWIEDRRADLRSMNDFYFMTLLLFCFTCQFCHTQYLSHAEKNK